MTEPSDKNLDRDDLSRIWESVTAWDQIAAKRDVPKTTDDNELGIRVLWQCARRLGLAGESFEDFAVRVPLRTLADVMGEDRNPT